MTLCLSKMKPNTNFEIPSSNNKGYAPDTRILKTRSEVKVTVTQKWYTKYHHPKMHPYTKFDFLPQRIEKISNNSMLILETRSTIKVQRWDETLFYPKMHSNTKCVIPTSNVIRDMPRTWLFYKLGQRSMSQWPENCMWHSATKGCINTPNLEFLPQRI